MSILEQRLILFNQHTFKTKKFQLSSLVPREVSILEAPYFKGTTGTSED